MLSFESDYIAGAHPRILERLTETNREHLTGYGNDHYTESAKKKIRDACECDNADIYFLLGGTQTNAIVISSVLQNCEGVISADTGHISIHEAGAVEYTGHKVLTLPHHNGKINPQELADFLSNYSKDGNKEHMVYPGMVYISHPTEYGTLYTRDELMKLSDICRQYGIPLYLDGARLGYGLMSGHTDVTLPMIAEYCDIFYIGGTKVGALCGEAVVFTKNNTPRHFFSIVKQHGALLAKGRLLGIQFDTLFTDNLYEEISQHAIDMAWKLKQVFSLHGYSFYINSETNQQFIILHNDQIEKLQKDVLFSYWQKYDNNHAVVRFATSWETSEEDIKALNDLL